MKINIKRKKINSNNVSLAIDGEMSVYTVRKLKKLVNGELEDYDSVDLNLQDVTRIDTSGFQLLLYLKREAKKINKKVSFSNPGIEVKSIFGLYNEII